MALLMAEFTMPPALFGRITAFALGFAALAGTATAAPRPGESGRAAVLQAVADCRKLTEDKARLACFDKAVDTLDQAESKGQVIVIDREQAKVVRRQAFGLTLPAFTLFNKGTKEDQIDRVTIELGEAYRADGRHWTFVSTDGVIWVQNDDESLFEDPHKGSQVAIRKAALGSYFCNVDGQRAVRCERRR